MSNTWLIGGTVGEIFNIHPLTNSWDYSSTQVTITLWICSVNNLTHKLAILIFPGIKLTSWSYGYGNQTQIGCDE